MKLSAADHQALRSAGFTAVGRVFGNHVRRAAVGKLDCRIKPAPARPQERVLASALDEALHRLRSTARGADGVIGIRVTEEQLFGRVTEISVSGVAVRASGAVRPAKPFLSDLSGCDFAKLLHSGWVPCGLALGVAAVTAHNHELPLSVENTVRSRELGLHSAMFAAVQQRARKLLGEDCARLGGAGLLLGQSTVRMREPHCWMRRTGPTREVPDGSMPVDPTPALGLGEVELHGRDLYAETILTGTAITPFRPPQTAPLMIMPLNRGGAG
ncbi:heavy metal-binding domain-containing protein [Nocardia sp. NRRL S-836]|uniref:heavy metal-binding domain-containing protein n=1 Tax=Nocardia sp. NRRL S-836 TaxID=1519492 RepID=UPI0006ADA6DB|nr:heavy metal-binding domain-containing protein [Nocardia sp. NRRL S-836]KOV85326.1 hypothetical protein ADL03_14370 [Nocardia sp. NRRL S-836]